MRIVLNDIKRKAESLAKIIEAPIHLLPAFDGSLKQSEVIIDDHGFLYYVTQDQGMGTREHHICFDEDDLLYKVFKTITFSMALDFVAKNSSAGNAKNSIYSKQEELLGKLSADWGERKHAENWSIWH